MSSFQRHDSPSFSYTYNGHGAYCTSPTDAVKERAQKHADSEQRRLSHVSPISYRDTSVNIATAFSQQQQIDSSTDPRLRLRSLDKNTSPVKDGLLNKGTKNNSQEQRKQPLQHSMDEFFATQTQETEDWNPYEEEEMLSQNPHEEARRRYFIEHGGEELPSLWNDSILPPSRKLQEDTGSVRSEDTVEREEDQTPTERIRDGMKIWLDKTLMFIVCWIFWVLWFIKEVITKIVEGAVIVTGCLCYPLWAWIRLVVIDSYVETAHHGTFVRTRVLHWRRLCSSLGILGCSVYVLTTNNIISQAPIIHQTMDWTHQGLRHTRQWIVDSAMVFATSPSPPTHVSRPLEDYISTQVEQHLRSSLEVYSSQSAHASRLSPELESYIKDQCVSRKELQDHKLALDELQQEIHQRLAWTLEALPGRIQQETDKIKTSLDMEGFKETWSQVRTLLDAMEAFSAHPHTALSTPQVNTVDYALATAGAQVIQRLTHKTHTHYPRTTPLKQLSRLTGLWSHQAYSAEAALMPGNEPGQCWTMEGTQGTLGIHLSQPIVIENITMEYNLNIHPTHAPRMFQVWGFKSLKDITSGRVFSFEWPWVKSNPGAVLLGTFEYQLNGPMSQAFEVSSSRYFIAHVVLVRVMSNWGNEASTSLYRLKVHGVPEERS